MIKAKLEELSMHVLNSDRMKVALEFLKSKGQDDIPEGRFEVQGDEVFGYSQRYETEQPTDDVLYEAHRKYIDVQYIIAGSETMRWLPLSKLTVTQKYDESGDCLLGVADGLGYGETPFKSGEVMVMFPNDAHAAGLIYDETIGEVRKLVVKVALD